MKILVHAASKSALVKPFALELPLFTNYVPAGFASPIEDFVDRTLDLNEYIIQHPSATFFVKVSGDSMLKAGIHDKDILVVDRALVPTTGKVVVAVVNGEFTIKRLGYVDGQPYLFPENEKYKPLCITEEMGFTVWGVATHVLHKL